MAEIINLKSVRKTKARSEKERLAHNNRIKHGTPKALKDLADAQKALMDKKLSGKKLMPDEDTPETE